MALARQIVCAPVVWKSCVNLSSRTDFYNGFSLNLGCDQFVVKSRRGVRRVGRNERLKVGVVAAISEDLVRVVASEKGVTFKVRAVVTVRNKNKEDVKETLAKHLDNFAEKFGRNVALELVSTEVDPKTQKPWKTKEVVIKDWFKKANARTERVYYTADFVVDLNFGIPGSILVTNKHQKEFFLESITLEGFACGPVHFPCSSWVQSQTDHPKKRIFFTNKPYLPHETPSGLKTLREEELKGLRGDGTGERKLCDRIYDYDVYNDLGNPDKGMKYARPTLGGETVPYPRRCRTGRPPTYTDMNVESRVEKPLPIYVPRDEHFEESKLETFLFCRLKGVLHNLLPQLMASISTKNNEFQGFSDIDKLYKEGLLLKFKIRDELLNKIPLPKAVVKESSEGLLKYDLPLILSKDKFAWLRDDEFARQMIAGVNPVSIERLHSFPPVSSLDPGIYGSQESAFTEEDLLPHLHGMSVQQALDENRLFIVDYHDAFLPFLNRINAQEGHKSYATRTIFFKTNLGTLKPIAIELSLPISGPYSRSKRVITPPSDATNHWVWQLAKAHVCSNDAGAHQLVHHWLRTHACLEPFIIAANRQLSVMHPIYKLLDPHMRYTLEINGLARQILISNEGIVESCFSPGRYHMEISAAAYKNNWRFDMEGLPADLIRRGMAVPDATQPHGVRLVMEDYPYAADGLLIWAAIEKWVKTYVKRYYPSSSIIEKDNELQAWYSESINVGHGDLKDAHWWPKLNSPENLASILTTLIWLGSAMHAALNFGQYPYGGYVPNRPSLMRKLIPEETDSEYNDFLTDPQKYFLSAIPGTLETCKYMAVVDMLSTHSPDEEYLGERKHPSTWTGDAEMIDAFYSFSADIRNLENEIVRRNLDPRLKNRCGAGVLPYELLAPSSEPGVTCRGVPNSTSI